MKNILLITGNPAELVKQLETLRAVFGRGATLEEVATATKSARANATTRAQLCEEWNNARKNRKQ